MLELLASSLRLSTPLIFAAMGGVICERSGVATICLEAAMIMGAWVAAVVNFGTNDPWLALSLGILGGAATMALHAFLSVTARADQIVSGVAVNLLAAGVTPLFNKSLYGSPTNTPAIPLEFRFHDVPIPLLSKIPFLGELLFDQKALLYIALVLPFLVHWFLFRTGLGLRVLASGDAPEALRTAGVSPSKVRYASLIAGGAIASLGGVYLSIGHASQFTRDMTAGRGFIALAAVIFGKWRPLPAFLACLFFGFTDALQIQLQSLTVFGWQFPVQFIQLMPYAVTLLVLVGFIGRARPPLSIGK